MTHRKRVSRSYIVHIMHALRVCAGYCCRILRRQRKLLKKFSSNSCGPAIFSAADLGVKDLPQRATSLSYLQAALDGGWPNERCEERSTKDFDSDTFAQLFDEEED